MTFRRSVLLGLPVSVFAASAALFFAGLGDRDDGGLTSTLINKRAPNLALSPLGGRQPPGESDISAPQVKLVNFWASWCAPCRAEHPNLQQLKDRGFPILGVNYKDQPSRALGFLDELGNPYAKIGADKNGRAAIDWGVYGVPETFVIDGDGVVRLRWAGPVTSSALDGHIMPALQAAAQN